MNDEQAHVSSARRPDQQAAQPTIRARIRFDRWLSFADAYEKTIRRRRLFIPMARPPAKGTIIGIVLSVCDESELSLRARVLRVVPEEEAARSNRRSGIEARLELSSDDDRAALMALGRRARARTGRRRLVIGTLANARTVVRTERAGARAAALRACLESMAGHDDAVLLEVVDDASDLELRRAYEAMVERWHPVRFAGESEEVRETVAEIAILFENAYQRLRRERAARSQEPTESEPAAAPLYDLWGTPIDRDLEMGERALRSGQPTYARSAFRRAHARNPDDCHIRYRLALAEGLESLQDGRLDDADRHFEKALALDPECREAAKGLSEAATRRRDTHRGLLDRLLGRD